MAGIIILGGLLGALVFGLGIAIVVPIFSIETLLIGTVSSFFLSTLAKKKSGGDGLENLNYMMTSVFIYSFLIISWFKFVIHCLLNQFK